VASEENVSNSTTGISRVKRSKAEAKASYDTMSRWYDVWAGSSEKQFVDAGLQKLCAQEGERVLEIGFGTGHGILALAQSVGDSGKVYGIDISEGMFDITQARVSRAGLSKRVELECGDAASLPFAGSSFDAVFMSFTLELFDTPEIPTVLHECQRVLRDSGRVCVVAMSKKGKAGLLMRIYEWAHRRFPRWVDCRPIFAQEALEDAGFQALDVTQGSMWGLPVEVVLAKKA
jgi:demethylmenaquinone methyltransferase/2-methoxy-6-polyprenyl-1,4-benzoquinol methylase